MILYYAMGGGLGHLTRARAVIHTLGLGRDVALLSATPALTDRRVVGDLPVLSVPLDLAADLPAYRAWLSRAVADLAPDAIFLDAFPAGILGELCDLPVLEEVPLYHLARLLRWPAYQAQLTGAPPRLEISYVLEPLVEEHARFLSDHSRQVRPLRLVDEPARLDDAVQARLAELTSGGRPLWLIVHAGGTAEVAELIAYAEALQHQEQLTPPPVLVLVSPGTVHNLPPHVVHLDVYPALPLFPLAGRIITAAGFNIMRQTEPYREKHLVLPFERRFDDQFRRASRWRQRRA